MYAAELSWEDLQREAIHQLAIWPDQSLNHRTYSSGNSGLIPGFLTEYGLITVYPRINSEILNRLCSFLLLEHI